MIMNQKTLLRFSLLLNGVLVVAMLVFGYVYRNKIMQRLVTWKGNANIVMFGNSITEQGHWAELLGRTDVSNSGLSGFCTHHFKQLLEQEVLDRHPRICFVEGGINDITVGVEQAKIKANFQYILETLRSQGIIPVVTLTMYEQNDPVSKAAVDDLNMFLRQYCNVNQIEYIDLNPHISDARGLKKEFAVDKTHLNGDAYKIWASLVTLILKKHGI